MWLSLTLIPHAFVITGLCFLYPHIANLHSKWNDKLDDPHSTERRLRGVQSGGHYPDLLATQIVVPLLYLVRQGEDPLTLERGF
jgi:hypothetical protein